MEHSLDLARQLRRLLEEATCLLMLGSCKQDQVIWQETVTLKEAIGADLGLDQESIDDPPFCAAVIIIRGEF